MKTVLVTGSSGKLGREIVFQLKQQGYSVWGVDLTGWSTTDEVIDVRRFDQVWEVSRRVDAVIHTAALHGRHTDLGYSRQDFMETNINGTLNLLNACQHHGIAQFVYTSTTSIYGKAMDDPNQAVWVDETLPPIPRDIYDITKQAAENLCADFSEKEGIQTCALRVSRFLDEPTNTTANYRLYRGLDVRDGATAHLLALQRRADHFDTFNISARSPFQFTDLSALKKQPAEVIRHYFPEVDAWYSGRNWNLPTSIDRVYVTENAEKFLAYRPYYNFEKYIMESPM